MANEGTYLLGAVLILGLAGCSSPPPQPVPNVCAKHGGTAKHIGISGSYDTDPYEFFVCRDFHIVEYQDGIATDYKDDE